uniref:Phosphinomethylmalate isomerase n=1 Tax=Streptomyces viridochromogenes (strain DSM 40736 / JCM 4977 / BCRC 1201 / Tue 494) TaxID=591159 RepID=PMI_STRVT|nr:aconitate hydratase AcnA [Streptomyces viridochromogenes]AAU00075.1 phosphinomethylmalate isomerase [Streptomyces viridochromogenes]
MRHGSQNSEHPDSFGARDVIEVAGESFEIFRLLNAVPSAGSLPYSLRILLENLLRHEDGVHVHAGLVDALAAWDPRGPAPEILFHPARVVMQDYSGVPCLVDLAAMREAFVRLGGAAETLSPQVPVDLVVDHSVMADVFGTPDAYARNAALDHARNRERYELLRWAEATFDRLRIVPPNTGIIHQVNLERLAGVVIADDTGSLPALYPDTVVGTDSHTPMVNGLGVLGWGVGGIEAVAAVLGRPLTLRVPKVIGCELTGRPADGVTATDIVLTLTERLRAHGVVGAYIEFNGPGLAALSAADRATIANMCPEYGATAALFPVDDEVLRYLRATGRPERHLDLVRAYAETQGLWYDPAAAATIRYTERVRFDLASVVPSIAGPRRPQDRVPLATTRTAFAEAVSEVNGGTARRAEVTAPDGSRHTLGDGAVVLAAITSCTNTSNPALMIAAGLLARKAVELGLQPRPWVKSTLAPGSAAVMEYLARAGLDTYLDKLGFSLVAYGCTSCIGNSGPLPESVAGAVRESGLASVAVLSGNRNFEGRINPDVRMNYLASPPLVVAYALAGTMDIDLTTEPLGTGSDGRPVTLADIWPDSREIDEVARTAVDPGTYTQMYDSLMAGDERWRALPAHPQQLFPWAEDSTYIAPPPYFVGTTARPRPLDDIRGARVLADLGDSVTTDHISPAGGIPAHSAAGVFLRELGVPPGDFNSYGARRCNHEVLLRGLFSNPRLRNRLAAGKTGGHTVNHLTGELTTMYEAAVAYQEAGVPLVVLAGREYGTGSSRDWAAKGPALIGVRAVIAESFERIHRSNLVGMGILPLEFPAGQNARTLGLTGAEEFDISGVREFSESVPRTVRVTAGAVSFDAVVRVDTAMEAEFIRHGGIMPFTLRGLLESA